MEQHYQWHSVVQMESGIMFKWLSPLLHNVYTYSRNHHLQATGVRCYVGGAWVNSLSYADDMVLLAPTVTALHTLLEVCRAYTGPHDIVHNRTKTLCMLFWPKQSESRYWTRVRLGNEELSFVEEFRYLGYIMTAECRDSKDIKKEFRRQNAVDNILVTMISFTFHEKSNCSKSYCCPIYGCALRRHSYQNSIRKITVSYSGTFKRFINVPPDTPARVWYLRWTKLTILMWCSANPLTTWWAE